MNSDGLKKKKILVTGGAGFIGSHLVDRLAKDHDITVVDNFTSGKEINLESPLKKGNIRIIKADLRDPDAMNEAVCGIDWIYHLGVQCLRVSIQNPLLVHEVNATGTLNLCQAALKNGIERFIYVSSSEVYGTAKRVPMDENHPLDPTTPYGASKLAGEKYAKSFWYTYGLPVIIVRPFNAYGPRSHYEGTSGEIIPKFMTRVLRGLPPVIFGDGLQTRDFNYVEDTAEGITQASRTDQLIGQEVNIGSGVETSLRELAELVLETAGRRDLSVQYEDNPRPGDVRRHLSDPSKAALTCKYKPSVSLSEGLAKYYEWLKPRILDKQELEPVRNW